MIAAIAITNRATHIVTHDIDDFRKLTVDHDVEIRAIKPGPPGQQELDITE